MPPKPSRNYAPAILIIIIILASVGIYLSRSKDETVGWQSYHQADFAFDVKYPPGWHVVDSMTPISCCLFLLNYPETATTSYDKPGNIKMQIGYYFTPNFDPFTLGSTTKVTLGGNTAYTGSNTGHPFYIIPRSPTEGFGIAVLTPPDNEAAARKIVDEIISTMKIKPLTNATSTPAVIDVAPAASTSKPK